MMMYFGSHPEALRSTNNMISADFPCYMGQRISERTGAEFIFFTGAIGGLISTFAPKFQAGLPISDIELVKQTGYLLGDVACDIEEERLLPSRLDIATKTFSIPLDNTSLMLASMLGLIVKQAEPGGGQ